MSCCQKRSWPTPASSGVGSSARSPTSRRCRPRRRKSLGADDHRQRTDAADEVGVEPHRWTGDLKHEVALQDLLPQDFELHLGQPVADAAMDAGAERQMLARLGPADPEAFGLLDRRLVA